MTEKDQDIDDLLLRLGAVVFEANPIVGLATRIAGAHEAITGHTVEDVFAGRFRFESIVLPEDLPVLVGGRNREPGAAQLKEYRYRRPDGSVGWLLDITHVFASNGEPRIAGLVVDITEQRRSEAAAGVSARQLRESLDRLDVLAVALDAQARVTFCNARVLERTGYSESEVIGEDWYDRFLLREQHRREEFDEALARGEVPKHVEGDILTRSGERLTIRWTNAIIRDLEGRAVGTYSLGEDVTEVRRTARALAASEGRYRQLFETMNDGFMLLDAEGQGECRFLEVNPAFERMVRQPAQSLVGRSVREVFVASTDAWLAQLCQVAMTGEPVQFEQQMPATGRDLELTAFRPQAGRVAALVVDVTERKRLQSELLQASKLESIGRLAAGIAHDFNNLLTVILGGAQLALLRMKEDNEARAELDNVTLASERAARLTSQLLAYARKQRIEPRALNLTELVGASTELLRRLLSENIKLTQHLTPDLWPVWGDPAQLEQVVLNLALNARDAMPKGGTLTLETENVVLDADAPASQRDVKPGEYVRLVVRDTGEGIPQAIQPHVFEPFFSTKGSAGTGLGLATCQAILQQHGGQVRLDSEPGRGTTFEVYLPAYFQAQESEVVRPPPARSRSGSETLLVVEDDPLVLQVAVKALRTYGYQVLAAQSGEDAVALAGAFRGDIDALITDFVLPGMTGRELAERLSLQRPALRVLCLSGYAEDPLTQGGPPESRMTFLDKPYKPEQLADKLRALLDHAGGAP